MGGDGTTRSRARRLLVASAIVLVPLGAATGAAAQDGVEIELLHAIPAVGVDVYDNGTEIISGFQPDTVADLSQFAGRTLAVELRDAADQSPLTTAPISLTLPDSGDWTLVAHLAADGSATITPFENDDAGTPAGQGRLVLRHTAAAPALAMVDATGTVLASGLSNGSEIQISLPAGLVDDVSLGAVGGDPIADVPAIELGEGQSVTVYAVGSIDGTTFDLIARAAVAVGVDTSLPADTSVPDATSTTVAATDATQVDDTTPAPGRVDTGAPISGDGRTDGLVVAGGLFAVAAVFLLLRGRIARV